MPYLLLNARDGKEPGFQSVDQSYQTKSGEVVVPEMKPGWVYDAVSKSLRQKTEAERKAEQDAENARANADLNDLSLLQNSLLAEGRAMHRILQRRGLA